MSDLLPKRNKQIDESPNLASGTERCRSWLYGSASNVLGLVPCTTIVPVFHNTVHIIEHFYIQHRFHAVKLIKFS